MKRDEFWGAEDEALERVECSVHADRCELQLRTGTVQPVDYHAREAARKRQIEASQRPLANAVWRRGR